MLLSNQEASSLSLRVNALNEEAKRLKEQEHLLKEQFRIRQETTKQLNIPASALSVNLSPSSSGQLGGSALASTLSAEQQNAVRAYQNTLSQLTSVTKELNQTDRDRADLLRQLSELGFSASDVDKLFTEVLKEENKVKAKNTTLTKEQIKALEDERKRRLELLEKIAEVEAEYDRKAMTQEEEQLQAVRDRFKKLASEIEQFNADPKNKIKIDTAILEPLRQKAEEGVKGKIEVEKLKLAIAEQKQLFEQFENYKQEFGEKKAKERFAGEKAEYKSYLDYLKSLMPEAGDSSAGANSKRDFLSKAIPEAEKQERKKNFDEAMQDLKRVLDATRSAKQEELQINRQFEKDMAVLRQEFANNPAEFAARAKRLEEEKNQRIQAAYDTEIQRSAIYKTATEQLSSFTRQLVKEQLSAIKEVLKSDKLSAKEREQLLKKLKELEEDLKLQTAGAIGKVAASLKEAASLVGRFDEAAGKAVNTVANLAESAANIFKGLASGDPFSVISGAIGAITALYDLFDTADDKRAAAEARQRQSLEKTQLAIESVNRLLEQQAKIIDKALGSDKIEAYRRQLRLITADIMDTINRINKVELFVEGTRGLVKFQAHLKNLYATIAAGRPDRGGKMDSQVSQLSTIDEAINENRKAIESLYAQIEKGNLYGNVDELKELLKVYEQLEMQLDEYRNKLKQVVTGTTFASIVDSIADGFKQGYKSAEDFAKNFEELMKNAVIQSLKMQALEKPLQEFYDKLALASESGGSLDDTEIEELRLLYQDIINNAGKRFEELQAIAGINFKKQEDTKPQGLAGAIKGITADQADILSGQFNAMRVSNLTIAQGQTQLVGIEQQSLTMLQSGLSELRLIEVNTRNTAQSAGLTNDILSHQLQISNNLLHAVDRKLGDSNNLLRLLQ